MESAETFNFINQYAGKKVIYLTIILNTTNFSERYLFFDGLRTLQLL